MTIELEEGDRQTILLALAKLSHTRPGWHPACLSRIAEQLGGRAMYEEFRAHGPDRKCSPELPEPIARMTLWAWVGEDELGSGEVGLKQARVPAGVIPLVACKEGKIDRPEVILQMQAQATVFAKTIRMARFTFEAVEMTVVPGG